MANNDNFIDNLKNMFNNTDFVSGNSNTSPNGNLNITPDMISNLADMLKSKGSNFAGQSHGDMSNSSANDNVFNKDSSESNDSSSFNMDFDTIFKMKSIMETFNKKDDPRSNLLHSLKPYLRETRKKKIDQYVNLFKITQVTNLFKNEKGDET